MDSIDDTAVALVTAAADGGEDALDSVAVRAKELLKADPSQFSDLLVAVAELGVFLADVNALEQSGDFDEWAEAKMERRFQIISLAAGAFKRRSKSGPATA